MSNLGKGFLISLCLHLIALSAMAGIARMWERNGGADAVDISLLVIGPGGRGGASAGGSGPLSPAEGAASAAFRDGVFNETGDSEMARREPLAAEPLKEQETAPPPAEGPLPRIPQEEAQQRKSLDADPPVPVKPILEKAAPPEKEDSAKPPQPSKKRAAKAQPFLAESQRVPAAPPRDFSPMALKKNRSPPRQMPARERGNGEKPPPCRERAMAGHPVRPARGAARLEALTAGMRAEPMEPTEPRKA